MEVDDSARWGLQRRGRQPERHVAPGHTLSGGFSAFGAAPPDPWRPSMRTFSHAGMLVESDRTRPQPDLQRNIYPQGLRQTVAEPFAGPNWGIGGSLKQGKKPLEPPANLDYVRAQRRHFSPPGAGRPYTTIEDELNRKGHVLRDGQRAFLARSGTFDIEQQVGTKRRVPLHHTLREGDVVPAGGQSREHVVYSEGFFHREGVTPSLVLGRRRYAPSAQSGPQLRERTRTLSFKERNALDVKRAERELVSELEYDEDACSPRRFELPAELAAARQLAG